MLTVFIADNVAKQMQALSLVKSKTEHRVLLAFYYFSLNGVAETASNYLNKRMSCAVEHFIFDKKQTPGPSSA